MHDELPSGIQEMIDGLRLNTSSDFCGLACLSGTMLRWKYTSGASNERVKRMEMRPGQDLVGTALRTGRTALSDAQSTGEHTPGRCPLMLAERLVCAIAVPVFQQGSLPGAVLLVGSRLPCAFSPEIVRQTEQVAIHLQPKVFG
ncbi:MULTISPECIES: GAF domain-containing protein [Paenibacillus]|uniref:GAF domain-containing protein n=1 Tax=Paenibacillus TaxID=44249 RepID=UPI0004253109|nr:MULTISPECIES: GAF domain-containing protein [Paenibacillus]OZQ66739.1 GAF domain-containing protein [Paenibacillus taichungensis]HBU84539.1 GAF domain-containing protein [Paenibacillus sp.]